MSRRHLARLGSPARGGSAGGAEGDDGAGYPRPMLRRGSWTNLDGRWDFAFDVDARHESPGDVAFDRAIEVPFSPETPRSGIGDTGLYRACWYRRRFRHAPTTDGRPLLLHFGAVDYAARVWVDGQLAAEHEGGYTPFEIDVTPLLARGESHELVVRAEDDPGDLAKPRGKQDWQLEPHSIWYPRTTGLWQTVWLESAPACRIHALRWTPSLERWEIGLDLETRASAGAPPPEWVALRLRVGDLLLVDDRYNVVAGEVHRRIALSDPGIDDFRNELLWSPSTPRLIDAELELLDGDRRVIDRVRSYTALRSIGVDGGRFFLNGRPLKLRMVLDQGYWPDTGLTPPDDEALRKDVELARAMGFNGARKHQKIEDPRYLYWADRLGLLVWEEMPSAYRFTRASVERLTREWMAVVRRDASHPCIVAWVPFNESWGVPNLPESKPERHYVEALYHLTKTLDPTRPVVGNDGWESVATDLIGIHDYEPDPARVAARYATRDLLSRILQRERPGGRALVIDQDRHHGREHAVVLSEFGGMAVDRGGTWGYSRAADVRELAGSYARLLGVVRSLELFAGFCYTQLTDTYQEANGLLYADRTAKFSIDAIAEATSGLAAGEGPASTAINVTERDGAPR